MLYHRSHPASQRSDVGALILAAAGNGLCPVATNAPGPEVVVLLVCEEYKRVPSYEIIDVYEIFATHSFYLKTAVSIACSRLVNICN